MGAKANHRSRGVRLCRTGRGALSEERSDSVSSRGLQTSEDAGISSENRSENLRRRKSKGS